MIAPAPCAPSVRFAPSVKMNDGKGLNEETALEASGECRLEYVTHLVLRSCAIQRLDPECGAGLINLQILSCVVGVDRFRVVP